MHHKSEYSTCGESAVVTKRSPGTSAFAMGLRRPPGEVPGWSKLQPNAWRLQLAYGREPSLRVLNRTSTGANPAYHNQIDRVGGWQNKYRKVAYQRQAPLSSMLAHLSPKCAMHAAYLKFVLMNN